MKELKDNPKKMMKKQKEMWSKNMEYMRHSSFKSMIFTIIPVIIIFGWLSAHLAYMPLVEGEDFNVSLEFANAPKVPPEAAIPKGLTLVEGYPKGNKNMVLYSFVGKAGKYESPPLRFTVDNEICDVPLIIVESEAQMEYTYPIIKCDAKPINQITISNKPLRPLSSLGLHLTWFWSYLILSVLFSMGLRKLLKVY